MPELIATSGNDTWVVSTYPTQPRGGFAYPAMTFNARRILVWLPLKPTITGKIILSATLEGVVHGSWAAQNVTVRQITSAWDEATATWNNQPTAPTGTQITTAVGAKSDGAVVDLDVTAFVQAMANGDTNYGFQITTDDTGYNAFYGFDAGVSNSWKITVEYADDPDTPTQLAPNGVIGMSKWIARIDGQDDLAQIKVQVDPAASSTPAFDSGWVSISAPLLDLSTTSYAGLANNASTYWRAAVKTVDGSVSAWSEWVQVTRVDKPSLVLDWPSAGVVKTGTPTIQAHLSPAGTANTRWRVTVLDVTTGDVLWASGDLMGATLAARVPHRSNGKATLAEDVTYTLRVRAFDRADRVGSYGDPAYVQSVTAMLVDHDNSEAVPALSSVTQVAALDPRLRLHWTRTGTGPDEFRVRRDGEWLPDSIDPAGALVGTNTWEWVDNTAAPNVTHAYQVVGVTNDNKSVLSNTVTVTAKVTGVWFISRWGVVCMTADDVDSIKQVDKRTTIALPYAAEDIDIITGIGGYQADSISLHVDSHIAGQDVDTARALLEKIRQNARVPVQMVWGTVSAAVFLRGLSVAPYSLMTPGRDRDHLVTFGMFQTAADPGF